MPRVYDSERDYPIILEAMRKEDSLTSAARTLTAAGIRWPDGFAIRTPRDADAVAIDKDMCRACVELGLHPKKEQ